jgi:hypothetical protein
MAGGSTISPARWRLLATLALGLSLLCGLLIAPPFVAAAAPWAGRWQTNLGVMELQQDGSRVYGVYEADQGQIGGTAKGRVLTGTWAQAPTFQPPKDGGTLELTMSNDGQSFTGRWRHGTSGAWEKSKWSGQRLPPEPTPSPTPDLVASIVPTPAADPVAAVNAFLDALVAKQWDRLPALACATKRAGVVEQSQLFGAAELKPLVDAMTIEIADRDVTLGSAIVSGVPWRASIVGALVDVAGQLSVQVPEDAVRALVVALGAAGASFDPGQVDEFMTGLPAYLRSMAIASPIAVMYRGGGWLVCSDVLVTATSTTGSPSPAPN